MPNVGALLQHPHNPDVINIIRTDDQTTTNAIKIYTDHVDRRSPHNIDTSKQTYSEGALGRDILPIYN